MGWAISSAGKSAPLIRVRTLVRIQNSPASLMEDGGIAQLVERCLCKADVSGSSPLTSIPNHERNQNELRAYGGYLGT